MKNSNIILILTIVLIILAVGLFIEVFVLNDASHEKSAMNTTTSDSTVPSISQDSRSSDSEDTIESNRPRNDPDYKGYTPLHESEVTDEGWNPREHETYREDLGDGTQKIHYDDGYFRIVDSNGYVITYGYG